MVHDDIELRHALKGGAIAGAIAGAVLTAMMTVMSYAGGKDIWYGMKGAAAPFLGDRAMMPGFDAPAVLLGLVDHLAVSVIWGVLFSLVAYGLPKLGTVLLGALWGIPVWLGMYYVVLPAVGLGAMVHDAPMGRAIMFHVIFGAALGLAFVPFQRTTVAQRPRYTTRASRHSHA
jgi:hypothetical protein